MKREIVPYLVKRFLRFDKDQPFIFLSAMLAFLGITLGVMVLLVAMALMNGFDNEFKKKLTVMNYPLSIIPKFYGAVNDDLLIELQNKFPDLKFSPYIQSAVMARSGARLEGGYLFGVDFTSEAKVNSILAKAIKDTKFKKFDVLIGKSLKDINFLLSRAKDGKSGGGRGRHNSRGFRGRSGGRSGGERSGGRSSGGRSGGRSSGGRSGGRSGRSNSRG